MKQAIQILKIMNLGGNLLIFILFVAFYTAVFYFSIYKGTQNGNAFCLCKYLLISRIDIFLGSAFLPFLKNPYISIYK